MNDLHILNFRLVDSIPTEKPHYVYTVDVQVGGRHRCVEKRYSQFHSLHRQVSKIKLYIFLLVLLTVCLLMSSVVHILFWLQLRKEFQTPSFPPKRVRCSQPRLLEQRRRGLELYLRTLFQQSAPCRSQILAFLGLPHYSAHEMWVFSFKTNHCLFNVLINLSVLLCHLLTTFQN